MNFEYSATRFLPHTEAYEIVLRYAEENEMNNTLKALPLVRSMMLPPEGINVFYVKGAHQTAGYFNHALAIARALIDLAVPFSKEETDICIAAGLCHILQELVDLEAEQEAFLSLTSLDPRIYEIVRLITRIDPLTDAQQKIFYDRIQMNKLAVLVRLADRGNLVQNLHGSSLTDAREYVRETRTYFYPMCIYAKEHYPELSMVVSLLMDKLRYMIEVMDILTTRFRDQEAQLVTEIVNLKDENSRIRTSIAKIKQQK